MNSSMGVYKGTQRLDNRIETSQRNMTDDFLTVSWHRESQGLQIILTNSIDFLYSCTEKLSVKTLYNLLYNAWKRHFHLFENLQLYCLKKIVHKKKRKSTEIFFLYIFTDAHKPRMPPLRWTRSDRKIISIRPKRNPHKVARRLRKD